MPPRMAALAVWELLKGFAKLSPLFDRMFWPLEAKTLLDIIIQDRVGLTGPIKNVHIKAPTEDKMTVRDLIVSRVRAESSDYSHDLAASAVSRLDLASAELHAISSFKENGLFVIVDDTQLTELDQPVDLHPKSHVEFLRIIPLKGG